MRYFFVVASAVCDSLEEIDERHNEEESFIFGAGYAVEKNHHELQKIDFLGWIFERLRLNLRESVEFCFNLLHSGIVQQFHEVVEVELVF